MFKYTLHNSFLFIFTCLILNSSTVQAENESDILVQCDKHLNKLESKALNEYKKISNKYFLITGGISTMGIGMNIYGDKIAKTVISETSYILQMSNEILNPINSNVMKNHLKFYESYDAKNLISQLEAQTNSYHTASNTAIANDFKSQMIKTENELAPTVRQTATRYRNRLLVDARDFQMVGKLFTGVAAAALIAAPFFMSASDGPIYEQINQHPEYFISFLADPIKREEICGAYKFTPEKMKAAENKFLNYFQNEIQDQFDRRAQYQAISDNPSKYLADISKTATVMSNDATLLQRNINVK